MGNFETFRQIRDAAGAGDSSISNISALGLPADTRGIHILWMYPDILEMHGDRGNIMALLHYSNLMRLPCTIRKCRTLTEEIPFEWADYIHFPSGDLSCMADVSAALLPRKTGFEAFAAGGKVITAIASSGALLAEKTDMLDGSTFPGLGLLGMEMTQRKTVFGDDLWIETDEGMKILGNEIQLAQPHLKDGQAPFGKTVYGRGNTGDGTEGARSGNVIFTHAVGPLFARNPYFAEAILKKCAEIAGVDPASLHQLTREDIALELSALEDFETFIRSKMKP